MEDELEEDGNDDLLADWGSAMEEQGAGDADDIAFASRWRWVDRRGGSARFDGRR